MVLKKKSYLKKRGKAARITKISVEAIVDNPYLRHDETVMDLTDGAKPISKLRLVALKHAREMPTSEDGSSDPQTPGYIYSQPAIRGGSNWVQLGPTAIPEGQTISSYYGGNIRTLVTGRLTSIAVNPKDPDILYVGTAQGGIWKTEDGGRNWLATSDYAPSLSIGALVIDPNSPNILYAGTGEGNIIREKVSIGRKHPESYYGCGVLKTTDGGKKWVLLGGDGDKNKFIGTSFFRIAISQKDSPTIFAATTGGLYRSINGGEDWTQMQNGLPDRGIDNTRSAATDVLIHPSNPDIAYVAFRRKDKEDRSSAGIYKTSEANSDNPLWNKLNLKDFKSETCNRISLSISLSSPNILYALVARERELDEMYDNKEGNEVFTDESGRKWQDRVIDQFYESTDDGNSWNGIKLPGEGTNTSPWCKNSIGAQGSYNMYVTVDPSSPDIVYLGGVSLWKGVYDSNSSTWTISDIGKAIHPDNHAFAFDPNNSFIIYAGNDGGIYKSKNGGETWTDTINEGLCITQFEFIDHHPASDAVLFGGTQDNGTLQFRNNSAFYHSDDGDGGFVAIDSNEPKNIVHQYVRARLWYSEKAGMKGSWIDISKILREKAEKPISADSEKPLFYAPLVLDQSDSNNMAFGAANGIFLATRRTKRGTQVYWDWHTFIPLNELPSTMDKVSAINFVRSDLLYVGTVKGKVYLLKNVRNAWETRSLHDSGLAKNNALPPLYIWDISVLPDDNDRDDSIIIVMAGYGSQESPSSHIWMRKVTEGPLNIWHDIGGEGYGRLPDTPINALVIDPAEPNSIFIGTDIGVFCTSTKGKRWFRFSQGLPICAVYDMRLHMPTRLLRIATHGRGIWERSLNLNSMNDVNLFLRDHLMDTGRVPSFDTSAAFEKTYQDHGQEDDNVTLGSVLRWDMCADIKVDAPLVDAVPLYQMDTEDVDYVKFEYVLQHRNPKPGHVSNVYVQIHNRGIRQAEKKVIVKLLYAYAITNSNKSEYRYPDLPPDFWAAFPYNSYDASKWKPIGEYKILPDNPKTLTNTEATVLAWQWNVPPSFVGLIGILAIIDSQEEDPIPEANKILDIEKLVRNERHVGLRTLSMSK